MSESRGRGIVLIKKLPDNRGTFREEIKLELFPAWQWSEKFGPMAPRRGACLFHGRCVLPRNSSEINNFYRIKVNGKWYSPDGKQYEFFTVIDACRMLEGK